jgi:hypothetical protein
MLVVQSLPAARESRPRGTENRIIQLSPTMPYIRFTPAAAMASVCTVMQPSQRKAMATARA